MLSLPTGEVLRLDKGGAPCKLGRDCVRSPASLFLPKEQASICIDDENGQEACWLTPIGKSPISLEKINGEGAGTVSGKTRVEDGDAICLLSSALSATRVVFHAEKANEGSSQSNGQHVLILVGMQGSGKSTLASLLPNDRWTIVCQDDQPQQSKTRADCVVKMTEAVKHRRHVVIDRMNLTSDQRHDFIAEAKRMRQKKEHSDLQVHALMLNTDLQLCTNRILRRREHGTGVAGHKGKSIALNTAKLPMQAPSGKEGFDQVGTAKSSYDANRKANEYASLIAPSGCADVPAAADVERAEGKKGLFEYVEEREGATKEAIYRDQSIVVIWDKYPKSKVHLLVISREERLRSPCDLSGNDVETVRQMRRVGTKCAEMEAHRCNLTTKMGLRVGFHHVPSMMPLHMHVLTNDFDSVHLKTKRHYNSFNSSFFLPVDDALLMLAKHKGIFHLPNADKMLKNNLVCHFGCGLVAKNMPELKAHLQQCPEKQ